MTAQELHIEFDIGIQGLTSKPLGKPKPQEVDWFINGAIDKYVNRIISGVTTTTKAGYEDVQKRYDDLRLFLEEETYVPAYLYTSDEVYFTLPWNYRHLDSYRANIARSCKGSIAYPTENRLVYTYKWKPEAWTFSDLVINWTPDGEALVTLFDQTTLMPYPASPTIIPDKERYVLIDIILKYINATNDVQCYFENYNGQTYPNSFIFVTDKAGLINITDSSFSEIIDTFEAESRVSYEVDYSDSLRAKVKFDTKRGRIVKTNLYDITSDFSYTKTSPDSPLGKIIKDRVIVKHDERFVIQSFSLTYLKKFPLVSLLLEVGLPLPDDVCREIVGDAVAEYKGRKGSPSYQVATIQNLRTE